MKFLIACLFSLLPLSALADPPNTPHPTITSTKTATNVPATPTITKTVTKVPSYTVTKTGTPSPTYTKTPTFTKTLTNTPTLTRTKTITPTFTFTSTITKTSTISPTRTITPSITVTSTITVTSYPTIQAGSAENITASHYYTVLSTTVSTFDINSFIGFNCPKGASIHIQSVVGAAYWTYCNCSFTPDTNYMTHTGQIPSNYIDIASPWALYDGQKLYMLAQPGASSTFNLMGGCFE